MFGFFFHFPTDSNILIFLMHASEPWGCMLLSSDQYEALVKLLFGCYKAKN